MASESEVESDEDENNVIMESSDEDSNAAIIMSNDTDAEEEEDLNIGELMILFHMWYDK